MDKQPLRPDFTQFDSINLSDSRSRGPDVAVITATLAAWCAISTRIDSTWGIIVAGVVATVFAVVVLLILGKRNAKVKEEAQNVPDEPGDESSGA